MKCPCPFRCRYCGLARSRDAVGHYCKTANCQWQHGYSTCPVPRIKMMPEDRIEMVKAAIRAHGPGSSMQIAIHCRDKEGFRPSIANVRKILAHGPFAKAGGHEGVWSIVEPSTPKRKKP